jgi:hypothetical protein
MIQPTRPPSELHIIRASIGTYLQYARAAALPFLFLGLYGLAQLARHPQHAAELLAYLLVIIAPIYLAVFLHIRISRVGWDPHHVWKTGLLGKRTIDRGEIEGIAFRSVSPALSIQSVEKLIVYGPGKHILLTLWGAFWSNDDLRALANAISPTPPDTSSRPVSQRDFNREFCTGGSFIARHPNLAGIVGALVITLLICLSIVATEH